MSVPYKPDGYPAVSPYLLSADARKSFDFLERTFGAKRLRCHTYPDGRIQHGEMGIDDAVVMISDGQEGWPALESHVHVYVPDVDAAYKRALEAGGTGVQAPVQKGDADKRGGVKGPGGITWWISTQMGE